MIYSLKYASFSHYINETKYYNFNIKNYQKSFELYPSITTPIRNENFIPYSNKAPCPLVCALTSDTYSSAWKRCNTNRSRPLNTGWNWSSQLTDLHLAENWAKVKCPSSWVSPHRLRLSDQTAQVQSNWAELHHLFRQVRTGSYSCLRRWTSTPIRHLWSENHPAMGLQVRPRKAFWDGTHESERIHWLVWGWYQELRHALQALPRHQRNLKGIRYHPHYHTCALDADM